MSMKVNKKRLFFEIYGIKRLILNFKKKGEDNMSIYAVIRIPVNAPISEMGLFYVKDLDEAQGYLNIRYEHISNFNNENKESDRKFKWLWEVYELPHDFEKPKIKDVNKRDFRDFYQSPIPEIVEKIKKNAIKRII